MKQRAFEAAHRERWQAFAEMVTAAERLRRPRGARTESAQTFIASYRALCRELSIAKARGYSPGLIAYLNDLVIRGHNLVYTRRSGFVSDLVGFVASGFPRLVRAELRYVLLATLVFVGPGLVMGLAVVRQPELIYSVASPANVAQMEAMYDPSRRRLGRERPADSDFMMFGHYIWNNVSIGFRTFALGLTAGLGTLFILIYNGVLFGAISVHLVTLGYASTFLTFVVAHGALELTAIVLCGAAGLRLGHALLAPGALPRRQALVVAGRRAVRVVLGAAGMLVIAAFVEAFWSPLQWPGATVKYVVGAVLWFLVFWYFIVAGRGRGSVAA